jgi:hypothetical protein
MCAEGSVGTLRIDIEPHGADREPSMMLQKKDELLGLTKRKNRMPS